MYPRKFWNEFRLSKWRNRIFVAMSFDEQEVKKRYGIIKKAIINAGFRPYFLKKILTGDSIPIDIMKGIIECRLVLFDISPIRVIKTKKGKKYLRNSNVMYELGLANTWRNPEEVVVIRDDDGELPFDIQSNGVVKYNIQDKKGSIEGIEKTILFRLDQIKKIKKAITRKAAESLNIEAFKLLELSQGQVFNDRGINDNARVLAVPLLLSLGLIGLYTKHGEGYGYRVTELGREVMKYFEMPIKPDNAKKYKSLYKPEY